MPTIAQKLIAVLLTFVSTALEFNGSNDCNFFDGTFRLMRSIKPCWQLFFVVVCLLLRQGLEFKGQMLYCHESDCLLFLASPMVDGLEALTSRGLFISDIPIHDATRDVILVGEQSRAQVSKLSYFLFWLFDQFASSYWLKLAAILPQVNLLSD